MVFPGWLRRRRVATARRDCRDRALGVAQFSCGLQVNERRGSIAARESHQAAVVMDHSTGFAPRGGAERVVKVDCGLGIAPRGVLENAAIQCGASEPVIALEARV